jgi:hypothetical protein
MAAISIKPDQTVMLNSFHEQNQCKGRIKVEKYIEY